MRIFLCAGKQACGSVYLPAMTSFPCISCRAFFHLMKPHAATFLHFCAATADFFLLFAILFGGLKHFAHQTAFHWVNIEFHCIKAERKLIYIRVQTSRRIEFSAAFWMQTSHLMCFTALLVYSTKFIQGKLKNIIWPLHPTKFPKNMENFVPGNY